MNATNNTNKENEPTLETMIVGVENYIKLKKGVDVNINPAQFNNPVNIILLQTAYHYATTNKSNN